MVEDNVGGKNGGLHDKMGSEKISHVTGGCTRNYAQNKNIPHKQLEQTQGHRSDERLQHLPREYCTVEDHKIPVQRNSFDG